MIIPLYLPLSFLRTQTNCTSTYIIMNIYYQLWGGETNKQTNTLIICTIEFSRDQLCHSQRCTIAALICSFIMNIYTQKADISFQLLLPYIQKKTHYLFTTYTTKLGGQIYRWKHHRVVDMIRSINCKLFKHFKEILCPCCNFQRGESCHPPFGGWFCGWVFVLFFNFDSQKALQELF